MCCIVLRVISNVQQLDDIIVMRKYVSTQSVRCNCPPLHIAFALLKDNQPTLLENLISVSLLPILPTLNSPHTHPTFSLLLPCHSFSLLSLPIPFLQSILAGVKLRMSDSIRQFSHLAEAIGCGVVTLPDAKGLFRYNMIDLYYKANFFISSLS
jgi:hypothetical protein